MQAKNKIKIFVFLFILLLAGFFSFKINCKAEEFPPEETEDYSKIKINEIYPAPNTKIGEEEFVEIIDESEEEIDFSNWIIKDSKGAKGKISKTKKDGGFVVFYGSFSLNNDSNGDTVFLYDKKDALITSQKYSAGKTAYSYSFDGSAWRWTSFATPGKENSFDKILSGKIILSEKIYPKIYAYFDVKTDRDAQKFTWNFGDGHKSYLKSTKHKYEKTGEYSASLKITGNGEDALYDFVVKVEKYSAPKISIVNLSPNPKGSDTKKEWIEIKNESKKKVNLKGWSIATGWKKLINHPIREKFEIKPGKTKKLLRDICAFTLVNTKDKIELRDPSGKTVQKIKYDHGKKSVSEDGTYSKINGSWEWIETQNDTELKQNNTEAIENPLLPLGEGARRADEGASATTEEDILIIPDSEIQANLGKYTTSPDWQKKQKDRLILAYSKHTITFTENLLSQNTRVLGVMTGFKPVSTENYYSFTTPSNQKHWATSFFDSIWLKLNFSINYILLKIAI
ncbi:MAG: lamin tail domain-containing protein [bacterium]|nr:lamin tail domain-containing protein [bacterium]